MLIVQICKKCPINGHFYCIYYYSYNTEFKNKIKRRIYGHYEKKQKRGGTSYLSRKDNSFGGIELGRNYFLDDALTSGSAIVSKTNSALHIKVNKAFTLAEVLITLGIIGIVAALTIPTLIAKYQEKQTVTRFKWIYSTLANAYTMAIAENGEPRAWKLDRSEDLAEILSKHMRIAEKCYYKEGCLPSDIEDVALTGEARYGHMGDYRTIVKSKFNNGISLMWVSAYNGCTYSYTDNDGNEIVQNDYCGAIYAFISMNKFNRLGLDHFLFEVTSKGIFPSRYDYNDNYIKRNCTKTWSSSSNTNGQTCGEWIRRWNNADYWYGEE